MSSIGNGTRAQDTSGPKVAAGGADLVLTDRERLLFDKIYSNPLLVPGEFITWLKDRLVVDGLEIPVGQLIGFAGFVFQPAPTILTSEATTSTTYVDLATVGPTLTGLGNGQYAAFFGCQASPTAPSAAIMSISANGAAASDDDACVHGVGATPMTIMRMVVKELTAGDNSLTAKYRSSGGASCTFLRRWMIAIKYEQR